MSTQSELELPGFELIGIEEDAKAGRCTGRLLEQRIEARDEALRLLSLGHGTRIVAARIGASREQVRAFVRRCWESGELDQVKQRLGRRMFGAADLLVELVEENPESVPAHMRMLAAAQAIDKGQLLTGGATARVERTQGLTADQINALIDQLPVEVVSLPVEPEGIAAQKAAALEAGDQGAVGVVEQAPDSGASHPESPAFVDSSEVNSTSRADSGPESAEKGVAA